MPECPDVEVAYLALSCLMVIECQLRVKNESDSAVLVPTTLRLPTSLGHRASAQLNWMASDFDGLNARPLWQPVIKYVRALYDGVDAGNPLLFAGEDVELCVVGVLMVMCTE